MATSKIPITLVTGYLGSGKTTLINRLLRLPREKAPRLAVLVNEFGSVGIDGALFRDSAGENPVVELANGCLCCVVTGEFREALGALARRRADFDRIVIETSGAADPTAVIKVLWGAPELTAKFRLDGVVALVDAVNFERSLQADGVARLQAAVADLLVVSKTDRAAPATPGGSAPLERLRVQLAELNPLAKVIESRVLTDAVLAGELLALDAYRKPRSLLFSKFDELATASEVSHGGLTSVAASWDGRVSAAEVQLFFRTLLTSFSGKIIRTKALLHVEDEPGSPWLIQGVEDWIERGRAPRSYAGANRIVILGRGLDDETNALALKKALARLRAGVPGA